MKAKMKNVVVYETDANLQQRIAWMLKDLGYQTESDDMENISHMSALFSIDKNSIIDCERCFEYNFDQDAIPEKPMSGNEFIDALEEFHKPKMRDMTPIEVVRSVLESELKSLIYNDRIEHVGVFNINDNGSFYCDIYGNWESYDYFIQNYELLTGINDDGTLISKPFKVEE